MKHFLIVISVIVFVSLSFLHPSIIEDASFNDYEYLQKLRRTHSDVNTDDKSKGWQDNGIFNSWYQPGNGSEKDKALNVTSNTITPDSKTPQIQTKTTPTTETKDNSETKSESTNILPYLLLLLFMVVIVVIYIKYNY
jgi:hypothetical protein